MGPIRMDCVSRLFVNITIHYIFIRLCEKSMCHVCWLVVDSYRRAVGYWIVCRLSFSND